jgi:predicted nucleic acid-binding protein
MIVDASVILLAFFPDETGQIQAHALIRAHALGTVELRAPDLLVYEVTNAVLQAVRRDRITLKTAQEILTTFEDLTIFLDPVPPAQILATARRFGRSAYDAAYLTLAERTNSQFITGDRRLYNAVARELPWVLWLGDYQAI